MTRALLLCSAALGCLAAAATAQVTVPLPGGEPAPDAPPATALPDDPPAPPSQAAVTDGSSQSADINPYDRDIDMTVPLIHREKTIGDVGIRLTADDRLFVSSGDFLRLMKPILNEDAFARLSSALSGNPSFPSDHPALAGIALDYDPANLALTIERIEPTLRTVENLFETPTANEEPDLQPENLSAYLNVNTLVSYFWRESELAKPTMAFNGAVRLHGVVLEGDGQLATAAGGFSSPGERGSYRFSRNYLRLVYDEAEDFRRWSLGDLEPETRGQQSFVRMGGVSLTRQRRRFNDFRTGILQLDRQLVLQRDATVRIMRNGSLFRELRLPAGMYDFSALPLLSGSNDIDIQIRDDSGAVQNLSYQAYLDPIDLEPGDYEYALNLGKLSRDLGRSPTYDGPLAFSGFFRIAPLSRPALGVGLQASKDVQALTGQTQFILPNAGRLLLDAGVSNSSDGGIGYAAGLSYDQLIERGGLVDSFAARLDYVSQRFTGLGISDPDNSASWSLNGQYTRAIDQELAVSLFASVQGSRDEDSTTYRIGANSNYRISPEWSIRGGVDYTKLPSRFETNAGFGFTIGLVYEPDYRQRAEARYESKLDLAYLSYVNGGLNQIDTIGYGASISRDPNTTSLEGFADYIGNRFDASLSHAAFGRGLGNVADQNITTMRIGTTFALAGNAFGMGRRIGDSFAVVYPHDNLGDHRVVAGESLVKNQYIGRSGALGGALNNFLTSYVTQSVQYDVENPPPGYDIGPGVYRVRPPYRSGYAIKVGTDAFVSAVGTLSGPDGSPASLVSGRLVPVGWEGEPQPFFTNSAGRFAVANLYPGRAYRVELFRDGDATVTAFDFTVPKNTDGLVDLGKVQSGTKH